MSAIKVHSQRVILAEGDAHEFVPDAELVAGMHGFVVMVPPGEASERLLDMLWRITIAYAGRPSLLMRRTMVRKMVEAVMSTETRDPNPARLPARKSARAKASRPDLQTSVEGPIGPAPAPSAKFRRAIASLPATRGRSKAKEQK